jgi:hypothetical protein
VTDVVISISVLAISTLTEVERHERIQFLLLDQGLLDGRMHLSCCNYCIKAVLWLRRNLGGLLLLRIDLRLLLLHLLWGSVLSKLGMNLKLLDIGHSLREHHTNKAERKH